MHMDSISDYGHYNERFGFVHLAISVGSQNKVDELTKQIVDAGYKLLSGPRRTGDGYYESCIQAEDNLIVEITICQFTPTTEHNSTGALSRVIGKITICHITIAIEANCTNPTISSVINKITICYNTI